jgi:hypothetical protein
MSELRDKFFELLVPKMEALNFKYVKSKSSFRKSNQELDYQINLRWDGRGGLVVLENIWVSIKSIALQKAEKELTKINSEAHIYRAYSRSYGQVIKVPNMYSQKALDIANTMNFKELAKLTFQEKYPIERIKMGADIVYDTITKIVIPQMEVFKTERDVYTELLGNCLKEPEPVFVNCLYIFWLKMLSKKLNMPLPEKIASNTAYIQEFKEGYGSLGKVDFDKLEYEMNVFQF